MSILPHDVHLVDAAGFDVAATEKNGVPHDPADAATWPAWTDNWFWEPTDAAELAELEAAAAEADADAADAPDSAWHRMMAESFSLPPVSGGAPEPTAADRADLEAWLDQVDAPAPPDDQVADFPRPATAADRRAFQTAVVTFYRTHPGA